MRNSILILFLITIHISAKIKKDTIIKGFDTAVVCSVFSEHNNLLRTYSKVHGKFDGVFSEWDKDGNLKGISYYHADTMDSGRYYFSSGKMSGIAFNTGKNFTLYPNGDTATIGQSKKGKPIGTFRSYFQNRNAATIEHYNSSGQKHGLCETWREDGTRKDSIMYDRGAAIESREYFVSGKCRFWKMKTRRDTVIQAVFFNPKGKASGTVKNGNGRFVLYTEDARDSFPMIAKNGICEDDPVIVRRKKVADSIRAATVSALGRQASKCVIAGDTACLKRLFREGLDINALYEDETQFSMGSMAVLHVAALHNKTEVAMFLVRHGAWVNLLSGGYVSTSPDIAYDNGHKELARMLLKDTLYYNHNQSPFGGHGFVYRALENDDIEMFKFLLSRGLDPYSQDRDEMDFFQHASSHGSLSILKYLLTNYKLPDRTDGDGWTILNYTTGSPQCSTVVQLLLSHGLDKKFFCMKTKDGLTLAEDAKSSADWYAKSKDPKADVCRRNSVYLQKLIDANCKSKK